MRGLHVLLALHLDIYAVIFPKLECLQYLHVLHVYTWLNALHFFLKLECVLYMICMLTLG